MMTSEELMSKYRETLSEEAFGELVRRYIDLVYSTALRRLNGDTHLAEDAVQVVFCDLALKIQTASPIRMLGGWLHQHTCFVTAKMVRTETRRRHHEKLAMSITGHDTSWEEIEPHLDEALAQLNPAERHAIVLRFFERRDYRSLGGELGLSDDAAQKRVARAIEKLRDVLGRLGIAVTVAALTVGLGEHSVQAAPGGLVSQVTAAAMKTSVSVGGLTLLFLRIMAMTKLKLAIGAGLILAAAVTTGVIKTTSQKTDLRSAPVAATQIAKKTNLVVRTNAVSEAAVSDAASLTTKMTGMAQLRLTVLNAEDDKPLKNVLVHNRFDGIDTNTDINGQCTVPYAANTKTLQIKVSAEPFADTQLEWEPRNGDVVPTDYTIKLSRAIKISGQVLGPSGAPVEGAHVGFNHEDDPGARKRPASHEFGWVETLTDAQGRWEINRIAQDMLYRLYGSASHPEFVETSLVFLARDHDAAKQMLEGKHVFHLAEAVSVMGVVVDAQGHAIADASVLAGPRAMSSSRESKTGRDGTFFIPGCVPGKSLLSAEAPGFAATTLSVELSANSEPFKLVLQKGKTLRLAVVDKAGKPISGAWVWLNTLQHGSESDGPPLTQTDFFPKTDQDGRVVWEDAPDKELQFDIAAAGFLRQDQIKVCPDGQEHVVTLPPSLVVSGTVRDSVTQKPVPEFKLTYGWPQSGYPEDKPSPHWSSIDRFTLSFHGGVFLNSLEENVCGGHSNCLFKIEAEGYSTYVSRVIQLDEGEVKFDVQLSPSEQKTIKVVLPDGRPALGANVAAITADSHFVLGSGGFVRDRSTGTLLTTSENGTVQVNADDELLRIAITHPVGYAEVPANVLQPETTVVLMPWGRVEGTYKPTLSKDTKGEFFLQYPEDPKPQVAFDFTSYKVETDSSGSFAWPKVPTGRFELVKMLPQGGPNKSWAHQPLGIYIEVSSGKTTTVNLPGGYVVTARINATQPTGAFFFANVHTPRPEPPSEVAKDMEARTRWYAQPEIRSQMQRSRSFVMTQVADGIWTAEGVPSGVSLVLESAIVIPANQAASIPAKRLFEAKVPVTIPADPSTGTIDLGNIELSPVE